MEELAVRNVMIIVAVATVVVGGLILAIGGFSAAQAGEAQPSGLKRKAIILILAGPISLGSWLLFNGMLEGIGYRSLIGYALAAAVFVGCGFMTGFFSRIGIWRGRLKKAPSTDRPKEITPAESADGETK